MNKSENKTKETSASVSNYIKTHGNEKRQSQCNVLVDIMKKETGFDPKMWGPSIVGFGSVHYKYESGREGEMPKIAFSSRKQALTIYLGSFPEKEELLKKLGKYTSGKGCLYLKNLDDIDMKVLVVLIQKSISRR